MAFTFSINVPATRLFIDGNDAAGLRFEYTDTGIKFKAVSRERGKNIIPMNEKIRGGWKTELIEGPEHDQLLTALTNPYGNPFFELKKLKDGWFEAVPWHGPEKKGEKAEPARLAPHLRVWPVEKKRSSPRRQKLASEAAMTGAGANAQFLQPVQANSVQDLLLQIQQTFSDMDDLPSNQILARVHKAQRLLSKVEEPLREEARIESQRRRLERPKASKSTEAAAPEPAPKPVQAAPSRGHVAPTTNRGYIRAKHRGLVQAGINV